MGAWQPSSLPQRGVRVGDWRKGCCGRCVSRVGRDQPPGKERGTRKPSTKVQPGGSTSPRSAPARATHRRAPKGRERGGERREGERSERPSQSAAPDSRFASDKQRWGAVAGREVRSAAASRGPEDDDANCPFGREVSRTLGNRTCRHGGTIALARLKCYPYLSPFCAIGKLWAPASCWIPV